MLSESSAQTIATIISNNPNFTNSYRYRPSDSVFDLSFSGGTVAATITQLESNDGIRLFFPIGSIDHFPLGNRLRGVNMGRACDRERLSRNYFRIDELSPADGTSDIESFAAVFELVCELESGFENRVRGHIFYNYDVGTHIKVSTPLTEDGLDRSYTAAHPVYSMSVNAYNGRIVARAIENSNYGGHYSLWITLDAPDGQYLAPGTFPYTTRLSSPDNFLADIFISNDMACPNEHGFLEIDEVIFAEETVGFNALKATVYRYCDDQEEPTIIDLHRSPSDLRMNIPGDANLDGHVNAQDLNIVGTNWEQSGAFGWRDGDFNNDGRVDALDLNALGENWQRSNF